MASKLQVVSRKLKLSVTVILSCKSPLYMDVGLGWFGIWDSKVTGMWGYISWVDLGARNFEIFPFEIWNLKLIQIRIRIRVRIQIQDGISRSLKNFPSRRGKTPMSPGHYLWLMTSNLAKHQLDSQVKGSAVVFYRLDLCVKAFAIFRGHHD